jgi:hypothetical protein
VARRLRQVTDLYVNGKVAVLKDGTPVWVQVLNPFEQDAARNEAQISKARLTMAIKEFGSDEQAKIRMFFFEDGMDGARSKLTDARTAEAMPKILDKLRIDPEWAEKLDILERGLDDIATSPEESEVELLTKLTNEYTEEVGKRLKSERDFYTDKFLSFEPDELWDEYLDWYLARRGAEVSYAEYRLHQTLYGARWCEGVLEDGAWNHAECDGHLDRLFADKDQVRRAPEELVSLLMLAADEVEMSLREAKNSDRQGSSSDSSPLPSEEGASTASSPSETRVERPGTSASL